MKLQYTDEELIVWISKFDNRKDLREDNETAYRRCLVRNLSHLFPPKTRKLKYNDEQLIEWISSFKTITEMMIDDHSKYITALRRGLQPHFPAKRTRCGNITKDSIKKNPCKRKTFTDEELIEWISKFERRSDLRLDSVSKYEKVIQRGLEEYLPVRLNRGSMTDKKLLDWSLKFTRHIDMYKSNRNRYFKLLDRKIIKEEVKFISSDKTKEQFRLDNRYHYTEVVLKDKIFILDKTVDEKMKNYLSDIGFRFLFV
jgi:hypothetical protein